MTPSHLALPFVALLAGTVCAQPQVDIDLHLNSSGGVEVQLTPQTDFVGVPSSLVFTIIWDGAAAVTVPELQQSTEQRALMALTPSGPVHQVGDKRYRIYSGIGLTPIAEGGEPWRGGMSTTIGTFGPGTPTDITIADDAWVKERRHNGAFYISLNGLDRTGRVLEASAAGDDATAFSVSITPNPWNGGPLFIDLRGAAEGDVRIDLADAEGRTVLSRTIEAHDPAFRTIIQPDAPLPAGTYLITVRTMNAKETVPLVATAGER